ncbi:type 2 lantipeptide synthetase LanM family protein [Clostridium sp. YIM B02505]|uniref:Type 2 lantipeptide synthetase LanM family protein n=1 Tax=Clostridium yunnanense TaxID=2800325 RepID=A0ABS1EJC9_9CLOT|nr:type 2 lanthipeptide synthetase LanM family protein [Clostridium yunnanense]MBK1809466.1 type 2 lantipeptide synthetase LanM family protein [Clostridium yunnanense]
MTNNVKQLNISAKNFIYTLTIKERLNAFKENQLLTIDDTVMLDDRWLNIKSLVAPKVFEEELDHIDIKKEELAFAIKSFTDEEEDILSEYLERQVWFKSYKELMEEFAANYKNETVVCEQLILPFKYFAKKQLYNSQKNLKGLKIEDDLIEKLSEYIASQISKLTLKCLVVEISDYKAKNKLEGKDGRERYLDFLENCYKSPNQIQSFYNKYPVLSRFIMQKLLDLVKALKDMILDLDENFIEIDKLFNIETSIVKHIGLSLGDTHQNGKSVAEIEFENGKKYIYKPRNSYIEKAFNKFIAYINKNSDLKDLYINKVFYSETFTIEQFIESQSCKTINEVKSYYYRFGMLTALISILNGSDMHFENIIAHNQYPCIIDFETLFTQFNFQHNGPDANVKVLDKQVLNLSGTGLLPMSLNSGDEDNEVDVSALSGGITKPITRKTLVAKNIYTDDMCFIYENSCILSSNSNRLNLNGEVQEYKNFRQDIYNGFNDTLDWVFKNLTELKVFTQEIFNDLQVRQVMKSTAVYSDLIDYMDHPHYLSDMVRIEKLLENNWAYSYSDKRLVKYEIMDMLHLEIPIFYTNTSRTYLKTSNEHYINNYFKKDVLSKVIDTLSSLKKDVIEKEKIKLCLLLGDYKALFNESHERLTKQIRKNNLRIYQDEEVVETCNSIGKSIIKAAIKDEKSISWEYIDNGKELSRYKFINNGLYSGRAGILLYFYYLNCIQENETISDFTKCLIQDVKYYKEAVENTMFEGAAGSLYALLKCEDNNISFEMIQNTIIFIKKNNTEMKKINWLDGGSSLIKLIHNIVKTKHKSILALEVANEIIQSICTYLHNKSIESVDIGFGQGLIGLLYALLIGQSLLRKDYSVEIEKILYLVDRQLKNLKVEKYMGGTSRVLSGCNGFVGLGIGALACNKYIKDSRLDKYINLAIDSIMDSSFDDMSLYNGIAGELDFLASLSLFRDDPAIKHMIATKRNQIIDFYKRNDAVLIDELPEFRNYGLFSGLSGVGYSMLRTLFPTKIPSVLILD